MADLIGMGLIAAAATVMVMCTVMHGMDRNAELLNQLVRRVEQLSALYALSRQDDAGDATRTISYLAHTPAAVAAAIRRVAVDVADSNSRQRPTHTQVFRFEVWWDGLIGRVSVPTVWASCLDAAHTDGLEREDTPQTHEGQP